LKQFSQKYENFYYINFDDERFIDFSVSDFQTLMLVFKKLYDSKTIFIDEIQNIPNWERFVRRLYEEEYKIYITGSNAHLLSSELATHLTGRYIKIELFPFSFVEYLKFHNIETTFLTTQKKSKILNNFDEYLKSGGMPEYTIFKEKEILQRVYEDVIYKDLIVRFGIRNINDFKRLSQYVLTNFTRSLSYNSLTTILNISSVSTVKEYISYLSEAYLIFEVYKYNPSLKKQFTTDKKIFVIDNGIRSAIAFQFSSDSGKLLENMIFIELRRRFCEIWYYKTNNNLEIDFLIKHENKFIVIQVCYSVADNETLKREINAIEKTISELKISNVYILTFSEEKEILISEQKIKILPVWKFLLEITNI